MMLSTVNLNSSISKENIGQINTLSKKIASSINTPSGTTTTSLQPGSLSHLRQKLYNNGAPSGNSERRALGEITNTSKINLTIGNGKKQSSSSSLNDKLLFVPTSTTPQIRKKITNTTLPTIINTNSTAAVVAKVKKPTVTPQCFNETAVHSAPPAPLRISSKLSNYSIESLIMTPSYDTPIYTESFEEDIYKIEQCDYIQESTDSLMIEDNFSFADYYQEEIPL